MPHRNSSLIAASLLLIGLLFWPRPVTVTATPIVAAASPASPIFTNTVYLPAIVVDRRAPWVPKTPPIATRWFPLVSTVNALPEYPRPQLRRDQWLNLNGAWEFASGAAYDGPPFGQVLPETILVPFPIESALSGIMRREPTMWYRRTFYVPGSWDDQRVLLNFGAVDWEATVFVNGRELGGHRGGYDSFSFDITDALRTGSNELIVHVFDPTDANNIPMGKQRNVPRVIWYTSVSGIWQTVWLEPAPRAHITGLIMTPDVDRGVLRVTVQGEGITTETAAITVSIGTQAIVTAAGPIGSPIELAIPSPHLWSPDDPFLYDVQASLPGGAAIDRVDSYFGMRQINLEYVGRWRRITLNHQFTFQLGVLDQGYWPDGLYTAPTDEALRFDLETAKALGYNLVRKHVKVEPARWYYWADRLGLIVWQDMPSLREPLEPDAIAQQQFELELRELVAEHINSPSIIMWTIFNEGWGQHQTQPLTALVKALDPSRLVNNASGWWDAHVGDVVDWHNYTRPIAPLQPVTRAAVAGEFGGLGYVVSGHRWGSKTYSPIFYDDLAKLTTHYEILTQLLRDMLVEGLSGAVYTQISDVENEYNGWLTYDREVLKLPADVVRERNAFVYTGVPEQQ